MRFAPVNIAQAKSALPTTVRRGDPLIDKISQLIGDGEHHNDDWRAAAACSDVDPALFYPDVDDISEDDTAPYVAAAEVCEGCEVQLVCLASALDNGETDGMWGGMVPKRRRSLKRRVRMTTKAGDAAAVAALKLAPTGTD